MTADLVPLEIEPAEFAALGRWAGGGFAAEGALPGLGADFDTLDFSGWPIYTSASLPEQMAYDICGALAAREAEVPWEKERRLGAAHGPRDRLDADGRSAPPGRRALVSRAQMNGR